MYTDKLKNSNKVRTHGPTTVKESITTTLEAPQRSYL